MDDDAFLRSFEDLTLPFEQWTHRAHVKVAYLYCRRHPLPEATSRMRAGIQAYNAKNGIETKPGSGYNETVTQMFMQIVWTTIAAYDGIFPTATADEFCDRHPHLLQKTLFRLFYSPAGRDVDREVDSFVEPDLAPLPRMPGEPGPPESTAPDRTV